MKNSETNRLSSERVNKKIKNMVLNNIANLYETSTVENMEEITDNEIQQFLDYLTGKERPAQDGHGQNTGSKSKNLKRKTKWIFK